MKPLSFATGLSLLALSSCQLSSEKAKKEAGNGSIPPPKSQQLASNPEQLPEPSLPDLSEPDEATQSVKKEVNVIKSGDFEFKDVLENLPTQRDLAAPPAPIIPAPLKKPESNLDDEITKPLVTN